MNSLTKNIPTLSRLSLKDINDLISESENAFLQSASKPHETTRSLLDNFQKDPQFAIYGYIIKSKPASYITALSNKDNNTISIGPMFVSGKHRNSGLGKKQVLDFINLYKNKGANDFFTKTWQNNNASIKIFTDLGFKEIKRHPNDRIDGDSTIDYMLILK